MGDPSPLDSFLEALFPLCCPVCRAAVDEVGPCTSHRLGPSPANARCGRCAARLGAGLPDGQRCGECARRPPVFRRTLTLGDYDRGSPLREWVLALKHGGRRELAAPLARALAAHLLLRAPEALAAGTLVPVPLHPWRRLERGYDQALLLGRALARELAVPCLPLLRRRRWTAPQGSPGAGPRRANLSGAIALRRSVRRRWARRRDPDGWIWLVDDVLTSGATADECARVLRRAGAVRVGVLVLARARGGGSEIQPAAPVAGEEGPPDNG